MQADLTRRGFIKAGGIGLGAVVSSNIKFRNEKESRPNILFIYTDQQHGFTVSENEDYQFDTPAMDSLAQSGTVFNNNFCATPQCSPSRASLMTGQYPHRTGVITNEGHAAGRGIPLNPALPSIGNIFKNNGYNTVYFGKWHLGGNPVDHGWDIYKRSKDEQLTKLAAGFLSSGHRKPFFLFLSYLDPHDIYHITRILDSEFESQNIRLPGSFHDNLLNKPQPQRKFMESDQGKFINSMEDAAYKAYRQFYRDKVKKVDTEIGKVLDSLKKSGLLADTLVVCTSDHGDMDTAHRLVFKGPFMYEEMLRVPLIVSYPEYIPSGESRDQLVQNIDLLPTMAEFAGIELPHKPDGESFVQILHNKGNTGREHIFAEYYAKQQWVSPIRTIRTKSWKYNLYKKWGEELYDLRNDPHEINNLAEDKKYDKKKHELHQQLISWMKRTDDYFDKLRATDRKGRIIE